MAYKQAKTRYNKLIKTYNKTKNKNKCCAAGVWFDKQKGRYIKYTASNTSGYTKFLRRICNKKIRKSINIGNYNNYRRQYDYRWVLF